MIRLLLKKLNIKINFVRRIRRTNKRMNLSKIMLRINDEELTKEYYLKRSKEILPMSAGISAL